MYLNDSENVMDGYKGTNTMHDSFVLGIWGLSDNFQTRGTLAGNIKI